ncbi:MAG: hypothetical protein IKO06_05950 [Alphaproteobacteria bacterium]|nr:hypothetical protein [Alphaproteobacteria bacterium]
MWISKEKYEDIERRVQKLNEELLRLSKLTYLVDIKTEGIKTVFTFCQEDKLFTVETLRIISGEKNTE